MYINIYIYVYIHTYIYIYIYIYKYIYRVWGTSTPPASSTMLSDIADSAPA